jgi:hypothetical protein
MDKKTNKLDKLQKLPLYICISLASFLVFSTGCFFYKVGIPDKIPESSTISQTITADSETPESSNVIESQESSSTEIVQSANAQSLQELKDNFNDLKSYEEDPVKILKFLEENISNADQALADEIIYFNFKASQGALEKFTDNYADPGIQNAVYDEFDGSTDLEELKTSKNKKLADLAQETLDRKYKLYNVEGFIMPLVDYKSYSEYRQYLSQEMNDYMDIMQAESDKPSVVDLGIVIPMTDFTDRIMSMFVYIGKYPYSVMLEQIKNMKNGKLWVFFGGIDNTPVFENNDMIIPERLLNFQETEKKYENSEFGNLIKEYLDLLDQENYKRTQKVNDYLESFINP